MAKSPAFQFYPQDFIMGTYTMTDKQVGQYIRLLCLQHQQGALSEAKMLTVCKKKDPEIWAKFLEDENGLYYNRRLRIEIDKKNEYCKKQRENVMKRWSKKEESNPDGNSVRMDSGNTMVLPLENENIYTPVKKEKDKKKGVPGEKEKKRKTPFVPPTMDEVREYCESRGSSVDPRKFWEYFEAGGWSDSQGKPVRSWKQKLITWENNDAPGKGAPAGKPQRKKTFQEIVAERTGSE